MVTLPISEALVTTRSRWLGRYERPTPIRRRGAFHLASTKRAGDGRPCVVLVPGPDADPARAAEAFARIELAHNAVLDACVPQVTARGTFQGMPYLELGCDAVMDGVELHRIMIDSRRRVPL